MQHTQRMFINHINSRILGFSRGIYAMNNLNRPFQYSNTEAGYFHSQLHKRIYTQRTESSIQNNSKDLWLYTSY